ncbi:MAG TPA: hypothetical protein VGL87_00260 [Steroidobacteraceae bacterium]|jgi:hypothetical protein
MIGRTPAVRYAFALLFCPVIAHAGVAYDFGVQRVDQTNLAAASASDSATPTVTRYFIDDGRVRVGAAGAETVYLLEAGTVYAIEDASRTVRVLKHATLDQVRAHYADAVKQLQDAAAAAPPEDRAEAQRKASDMKAASDRLLQPVPRKYSMTARFESVDGHACRIWEERENDAKRLEICVAPTASVPGGTDVLAGMKVMSAFRQGARWALGVDFGLFDWWPDIVHVSGVPLLIREFKYDSLIREMTLTSIRPGTQSPSLWELPRGYRVEEGSGFSDW